MPETDHPCKYDIDFALLESNVKYITESIKKIKEDLTGNGKPGLKTEMEIQKQSNKRLWWFTGIMAAAILASVLKDFIP